MIKCVSFDCDGTLVDDKYDNFFWNEEIPKAYAEKNNISLVEAKKFVYSEYYKALYIERIANWTNYDYWLERFGLEKEKLLLILEHENLVYDDSKIILKYLKDKGYKIVVISNSEKNILDIKLKSLKHYVDKAISVFNKYGINKGSVVFEKELLDLELKPEELIHVGDDFEQDYLSPKATGIKSYLLRRNSKKEDLQEHEINSLLDLKKIL